MNSKLSRKELGEILNIMGKRNDEINIFLNQKSATWSQGRSEIKERLEDEQRRTKPIINKLKSWQKEL